MSTSTYERLQSPSWAHESTTGDLNHFSYDLPNRLHCSATYPALASNGSSILICAHASGLTVLWRGGRPLDPVRESNESDLRHEPIVASVDVTLDAAVLTLAFPPIPLHLAEQPLTSVPRFLAKTILVAVTCSDGTVRIVTIPLTPVQPSTAVDLVSASEDQGVACSTLGSSRASFSGGQTGASVTYTPRSPYQLLAKDFDGQRYIGTEPINWDLLVACYANEPLSRLSLVRVAVADGDASPLPLNDTDIQTHVVPVPHALVCASFESSRFPSPRHLRLLVADGAGAVRIAKVNPASGENDSPLRWLGTLHAPFRRSVTAALTPSTGLRCRILDAKWVLNGKAVMTLLEDGQWGIWDLEGAGPVQPSGADVVPSRGVYGGGVTHFTVRGFVGHGADFPLSLPRQAPPKPTAARSKDSGHLAPMTPKTRKAKQERLFGTHSGMQAPSRANLVRGGLSVATANPSDLQNQDESIALWYGSEVYSIPSLIHHWKRTISLSTQASTSLVSDANHGPTITQLPLSAVATGELINGVCQLPTTPSAKIEPTYDLVVSSEHRLAFLCPQTSEDQSNEAHGPKSQLDPVETEDHDMLRRGELDLGGMNRLLDNMTDLDERPTLSLTPSRPRRVGFAT